MSWIQKLYETYEQCAGHEPEGFEPLMPICHSTQQAQIEIVLDGNGGFKRASVIEKTHGTTLIPCTESSAGRAGSKPVNHPLCDKLQYVAKDFVVFGGEVTSGFAKEPDVPHQDYLVGLRAWTASEWSHPKLTAILNYVEKGSVVQDLVTAGILPLGEDGKLLKSWSNEANPAPAIFKVIQNTQAPEDAFVRWRVESAPDDPLTATWQDQSLIDSWVAYYQRTQALFGICMVTGQESALATQHPAKLRHAGDKAKLISANDSQNFTYRGRFTSKEEAFAVGNETSQKAHNALKWIIRKQGTFFDTMTIVTWESNQLSMPKWERDTEAIVSEYEREYVGNAEDDWEDDWSTEEIVSDGNPITADKFYKALRGYGKKIDNTSNMILLAFDAATPGRLALIENQELNSVRYLKNIEKWHNDCNWIHTKWKDGERIQFAGMIGVKDIADILYGIENKGTVSIVDANGKKLYAQVAQRLLPCIWNGTRVPYDYVMLAVSKASNPLAYKERRNWERVLTLACSFVKKDKKDRYKEEWNVALDKKETDRNYLYGRLLAVADRIDPTGR